VEETNERVNQMQRGTVKFFDSREHKLFGFIIPDSGTGSIFFHFNNGMKVAPRKRSDIMPPLVTGDMRMPKKGDYVVFESEDARRGPKVRVWAFAADWDRERLTVPKSSVSDSTNGMPSLEELLALVDGIIGLRQGIMCASGVLELTNEQIAIFVRNTPDGKKGEALWREFRQRQHDEGGDSEYTFVNFVREVLKEAGHPLPSYA
jgi:cold shock CspA family protein